MANGWAADGAVQDQIEHTVSDAVQAARVRIAAGEGAEFCDDCGDRIPEGRRRAQPASRTCVVCQSGRDAQVTHSAINRRGSKDSQFR